MLAVTLFEFKKKVLMPSTVRRDKNNNTTGSKCKHRSPEKKQIKTSHMRFLLPSLPELNYYRRLL